MIKLRHQQPSLWHRGLVQQSNRCGMAEHMRGNAAISLLWSGATQASCVSFDDFVNANLGNLWRRLVLPARIYTWSLSTSLQQRLVKTGGRLVKHARYYWLLLRRAI